jgi:hypothetical protein
MTEDNPRDATRAARTAPEVVAPTNRVNVAFPFSTITLQEPSKELAELAALVADLPGSSKDWPMGPNLRISKGAPDSRRPLRVRPGHGPVI